MERGREDGRDEVYERIPWETLERSTGSRQWLVYAVTGAVTLGAIAYSFTRSQPVAPPATVAPLTAEAPPPSVDTQSPVVPAPTPTSPVVIAEADLYAVDPERLLESVSAHAEWFAVEFTAFDGSEASRSTLADLLPPGIPEPVAPEGSQVYVDWAGVVSAAEIAPATYRVDVLVRSLTAAGDSGFERQPATLVSIELGLDESGRPVVISAPTISAPSPGQAKPVVLTAVPAEVLAGVSVEGEVVGGRLLADGTWEIVVMTTSDGIARPVAVRSG